MRSNAPPLLPILRSRTQGELLALVLDDPSREWTVSELARALKCPLTTVQSEVHRCEQAGLFTSRKVGRSRLVRPNSANPLMAPLTQVITLSFGAPAVVAREFDIPGVRHLAIFGSWAARFAGQPGDAPADIDVLVIGDDISRDDLYSAAERAEATLGRPVNPVIRSNAAWTVPGEDALLDEITRHPLVEVMSGSTATLLG